MNTNSYQPYMIVTGASGALGSVIVDAAQRAGWIVLAWDRDVVDVTDDRSVQSAFESIPHRVDSIVHCVGGIIAGKTVQDTSASDVEAMISLNLLSAFTVARHGLPRMYSQGGGSFVGIASQSILHPVPERSAYSAAKAGLASLMSSIAEEGRSANVRANTIVPGILRTAANLAWAAPGQDTSWIRPEEVAETVLHLCSPQCAISGAVIPMLKNLPF
jgi:NAD(P)-dependent dehydrogenase (short-subunit alcohol dehydrogenase family)